MAASHVRHGSLPSPFAAQCESQPARVDGTVALFVLSRPRSTPNANYQSSILQVARAPPTAKKQTKAYELTASGL